MNKIKFFILFTIAFYSPLFTYADGLFKLTGKIDQGVDGDNIMLFTFRKDKIHSVDTTQIRNSAFSFEGKEDLDDFAIITYGNYPDRVWPCEVILERGNIYVEMEGDENVITGTPLNELHQAYEKRNRYFSKKTKELAALYAENPENDSIKGIVNQNFRSWQQHASDFVKSNISNLTGREVFINEITFFNK